MDVTAPAAAAAASNPWTMATFIAVGALAVSLAGNVFQYWRSFQERRRLNVRIGESTRVFPSPDPTNPGTANVHYYSIVVHALGAKVGVSDVAFEFEGNHPSTPGWTTPGDPRYSGDGWPSMGDDVVTLGDGGAKSWTFRLAEEGGVSLSPGERGGLARRWRARAAVSSTRGKTYYSRWTDVMPDKLVRALD